MTGCWPSRAPSAVGNLTSADYANGTTLRATDDAADRPTTLAQCDGRGRDLATFTYSYDALGNVLAELARVGLGDRLAHRPAELSAGEQQRVAVARALVNGPRLLLADEPTGNLDADAAASLLDLLQALRADEGLTLIVATHNAEVAARADRVVRLRAGRVAEAAATR